MSDAAPYLMHFSEDSTITRFEPCLAPGQKRGMRLFGESRRIVRRSTYFQGIVPGSATGRLPRHQQVIAIVFSQTAARKILVVEANWMERIRSAELYAYRIPMDTFLPMDMEGYFTSKAPVVPMSVLPVGDLLAALAVEGVELRITPSLWPLHDALLESTLHFSMVRMRNAAPRPIEK